MPISLALGKDFRFFVFHSRNKYVTTDPASKGNTYLLNKEEDCSLAFWVSALQLGAVPQTSPTNTTVSGFRETIYLPWVFLMASHLRCPV